MLHVIILAAGRGSRLGQLNYPKALAPLSDQETILSRQLSLIEKYLPQIKITLVAGYKKECLMESYPQYQYVINDSFASENTAKSLLRALNSVEGDILWLNGDVVFSEKLPPILCELSVTSIVVNTNQTADEEVKYRADDQKRVLEISKEINPSLSQGEAVGINYFTAQDVKLLKKALEQCLDTDFFEKAIEKCIQNGMIVQAVTIPVNWCIEVDYPEDLDQAKQLILSDEYFF